MAVVVVEMPVFCLHTSFVVLCFFNPCVCNLGENSYLKK